jgi:hypothetical protein
MERSGKKGKAAHDVPPSWAAGSRRLWSGSFVSNPIVPQLVPPWQIRHTAPSPRPRGRPPPSLARCLAASKALPGGRQSAFPGHGTSCRFRRAGPPVRSREGARRWERER